MKITRKGLIKKLDALVKEIVLLRDDGCVTCPIWKETKSDFRGSPVRQPGHLFTRSAKSVRWDLRNVHEQCKTCNHLHRYHPQVFTSYVVGELGKKGYQDLVRDRHKIKRWRKFELEELREELEKKLGGD